MSLDWLKHRFQVGNQHALGNHTGDMTPKNNEEKIGWERDPVKLNEYLDKNQPDHIREAALANRHITASQIDKALGDDNFVIRGAAIQNPNATKEHLDIAMRDVDSYVKRRAIQHPNATKEHIDKALVDENGRIRMSATMYSNYKNYYPNGHEIVNGTIVAK